MPYASNFDAPTPKFVGISEEVLEAFAATDSPLTIIDSGSALDISGILADFYQINSQPTERINGVGGKVAEGQPCGYRGTFKGNDLNLKEGVYLPLLPGKRLI